MYTNYNVFKESLYSNFSLESNIENLNPVKIQLYKGKIIVNELQENIDISIVFQGKNGGIFNEVLPLEFNIEKNTNQLLEILSEITINDLDSSIDNYSALLPYSYETPVNIEITHNNNELYRNNINIDSIFDGNVLFTPFNIKGSINVIINGNLFNSNLNIDESDISNLLLPNILVTQGLVEWTKNI